MAGAKSVLTIIITLLLTISPGMAQAQFVTTKQAKDQLAQDQSAALTDLLNEFNHQANLTQPKVAAVFTQIDNKKIGATAAAAKLETIVSNLKGVYDKLLTNYLKTSPIPNATSQRTAIKAAQDILNDFRRQSQEGIDQAELAAQADPNKLTGKYLDYQNKIKAIADKGVSNVDQRLTERGSRDSVKKDLDKIIADTQASIDVATDSFLAINTDLLASALQRIKGGVLDGLSDAMLTRYKKAAARGNDKALDLTEEEQAKLDASTKELSDVVDKAIQTADSLTRQVASSNLPTSSNVPGVNPLLEAKYKAQRQITEIQTSVVAQIGKIQDRFIADKANSQLIKDVFKTQVTTEKNRLTDNIGQYLAYFSAGDPPKNKYQKAKQAAQNDAKGCTDFLCDIGRVVGGLGSSLLKSYTGATIPGSSISGLLGVKDGNPYARSRYQGTYSYSTIATPGSVYISTGTAGGIGANGQCVAMAGSSGSSIYGGGVGLAAGFVGVAHAASQLEAQYNDPFSAQWLFDANGNPFQPNYTQDANGNYFDGNGVATGATGSTKSTSGSSSSTDWLSGLTGNLQKALPSALNNVFGIFGSSKTSQTVRQNNGLGCLGTNGYNNVYSRGLGGYPVGQTLGYGTNNLQANLGTNALGTLASGLQILGQGNTQFSQLSKLLGDGSLSTSDYQTLLNSGLVNPNTQTSNSAYWQQPQNNILRSICQVNFMVSNSALQQFCRQALQPVGNTVGINPNAYVPLGGYSNSTLNVQQNSVLQSLLAQFTDFSRQIGAPPTDAANSRANTQYKANYCRLTTIASSLFSIMQTQITTSSLMSASLNSKASQLLAYSTYCRAFQASLQSTALPGPSTNTGTGAGTLLNGASGGAGGGSVVTPTTPNSSSTNSTGAASVDSLATQSNTAFANFSESFGNSDCDGMLNALADLQKYMNDGFGNQTLSDNFQSAQDAYDGLCSF